MKIANLFAKTDRKKLINIIIVQVCAYTQMQANQFLLYETVLNRKKFIKRMYQKLYALLF